MVVQQSLNLDAEAKICKGLLLSKFSRVKCNVQNVVLNCSNNMDFGPYLYNVPAY